MTKQTIGSIIVGLMTLISATSAQAFQGGKQGGMGFTGSPGGGFTGPRGGGFTETLDGNRGGGNALNRTPSFNMRGAVRPPLSGDLRGNAKRRNSADNRNRANTINNASVNRMGVGWSNPYMGYHQGWVNGYWNGRYPGGFGLSPWLYGPMLYNYGYSSYSNPYYGGGQGGNTLVAGQPAVRDYSQPINAQNTPPARLVIDQAASIFDMARQAFKGGDGPRALELVDHALESTPDDPALHEFRALTLFALKRYDEAAAALYAVLSIEPGWDWTTLIRLYANPETYTQQLLTLEAFTLLNPKSAPAHFVLAYHYLTEEYADAAIRQFRLVTAVQPKDALSAELIRQLERAQEQVAATESDQPERPTAAAPAAQTVADTDPSGKAGRIEGNWMAQASNDMNIGVTFQEGGRFTWKVSRQGKDQQFQGNSSHKNGILTFVQDENKNTLMGYLHWMDESHFVFRVMGAGASDPGLSFTKSS